MTADAPPELRPVNQPLLFQRLRWRLLRNGTRVLLDEAPIRPLTIAACSVFVAGFVFAVSFEGFRFLNRDVNLPLGGDIVGTLFDVLFLMLGVFLIFSTGLLLYGSLFSSPETAFLLSRPVRADQVFAYKFQAALLFSSWAFLLLGAPLLVAYGLVFGSPWYFYALVPAFFLGFVLLPGSLGGLCCLLIVNFIPRQRKQVLAAGAVLVVGLLALWGYEIARAARPDAWGAEAVNTLLDRFAFTRSRLAPSHWVARGLRAAAHANPDRRLENLGRALYNLALVWGNGLFVYLLTTAAAARLYRRGYNRVATGGSIRRRYGGLWMDRLLDAALPLARRTTRLLIVKDFRTFRRDPQQWAQILIFSGLLTLYFTNIRRLFPGEINWSHQNALSLLNLSTVALLLCTYTGRFVYPMLSLEGRKFWILGLLPLHRDQLLWGKFGFSTAMVLGIAEVLVLLSDLMLGMPAAAVALHAATVAVLAAGLSGLSVGLGAVMPNFREADPSKIAVGFGGTLNLVTGLVFLLIILLVMGLPWHLLMARNPDPEPLTAAGLAVVALGVLAGLALGAAAVAVPLHVGARALRRMEF
jgi:ABC-2 type transport system permease protein